MWEKGGGKHSRVARKGGVQCGNTERGRPQSRMAIVNKGKKCWKHQGGEKDGGTRETEGRFAKKGGAG